MTRRLDGEPPSLEARLNRQHARIKLLTARVDRLEHRLDQALAALNSPNDSNQHTGENE